MAPGAADLKPNSRLRGNDERETFKPSILHKARISPFADPALYLSYGPCKEALFESGADRNFSSIEAMRFE